MTALPFESLWQICCILADGSFIDLLVFEAVCWRWRRALAAAPSAMALHSLHVCDRLFDLRNDADNEDQILLRASKRRKTSLIEKVTLGALFHFFRRHPGKVEALRLAAAITFDQKASEEFVELVGKSLLELRIDAPTNVLQRSAPIWQLPQLRKLRLTAPVSNETRARLATAIIESSIETLQVVDLAEMTPMRAIDWTDLKELRVLRLPYTTQQTYVDCVWRRCEIEEVNLSGNQLATMLKHTPARHRSHSLRSLRLAQTNLDDAMLRFLLSHIDVSIEVLDISETNVTADLWTNVQPLAHLHTLVLAKNSLPGAAHDEDLIWARALAVVAPQLANIDLSFTAVTQRAVDTLLELLDVQRLILDGCRGVSRAMRRRFRHGQTT